MKYMIIRILYVKQLKIGKILLKYDDEKFLIIILFFLLI